MASIIDQDVISEVAFRRKVEQALYNIFNHLQDIRVDLTEGILRYPRKHAWLLSNDFNAYLARLIAESMDSLSQSRAVVEGMKSLEPHFAQFAAKDAAGKRTV